MSKIILIAHNLRSAHNVGSLLRTAEGLGIDQVYLTGYTPYPHTSGDTRLPHIAQKLHKQIIKTSLGAEETLSWRQATDVFEIIRQLRSDEYVIKAIEQTATSTPITEYQPEDKVALVVGREVEGVEQEVLEMCDGALEIPMFGQKESFNVVQAAAMALYHVKFGLHL
jgi:tRNA G18 (ribose-2'-O)-methylase SpoU